MAFTCALSSVSRPVPGTPATNTWKPSASMLRPKSMALTARSWPTVPSIGGTSAVVLNLNDRGSQTRRSCLGFSRCGLCAVPAMATPSGAAMVPRPDVRENAHAGGAPGARASSMPRTRVSRECQVSAHPMTATAERPDAAAAAEPPASRPRQLADAIVAHRVDIAIVVALTLVAALLRLWWLGTVPDGLH